MSRNEAKHRFTVEDHSKATEGIECLEDRDAVREAMDAIEMTIALLLL